MHAPDHLLTAPLSAATAVVAAGGVAYAVHRARSGTEPRRVALAVATTAFIFAAQMVNFPVLPGTSGHLIGAALAVALLGPWLAVLSVTLVLVVQSVVFADGGLTALGTNVVLMGLVGVAVAASAAALVRKLRGGEAAPRLGAALGAFASMPVAAAVLAGLFAVGGNRQVPFGEFFSAMVGVHALIGIGEAAVTVLVLAAVMALAPGLAAVDPRPLRQERARTGVGAVGAGALVSAGVLAAFASSNPDGLEAVSEAYAISALTSPHALAGTLLADYGAVHGLPVAFAGMLGLVVIAGVAWLLMAPLTRRSSTANVTA